MSLELPRLIRLLGYGIALLGAGSLFPHLPLLPRLVLVAGLAAGLYAERRTAPLVPHLPLTISSILLFLWYAVQFSRANPALPVVSILAIVLGTRLAAEKTVRTWLQTSAIALFCLSASSLFDLGPRFLLLLSLMLPLIALLLVRLTFQAANQPLSPRGLRQASLAG
ncbi:MAG: transglutaminaseTgpA domain-containing protein, partial [Candidatus Cloacimonetes bacterium]|nr:transglutaminaseTgpA domain-containing protein [Candidatus Cloacimonadota bacterium]